MLQAHSVSAMPQKVMPKLVVTSASTYWKPSEDLEGQHTLAELSDTHDQLGDQVNIGASVFSERLLPRLKRRLKVIAKPLALSALGAGVLAAGATLAAGFAAPVAAGIATATVAGLGLAALVPDALQFREESSQSQTLIHTESGQTEVSLGKIDDSHLASDVLHKLSLSKMKRYPKATHLLHLSGHGMGAKAVAGLSGEEASRALQKTVVQGGRKFDIALYETCFSANFELLHEHAQYVDYAVCFEDQVPASNNLLGRLSLPESMRELLNSESSVTGVTRMGQTLDRHFEGKEAPISKIPHSQRNAPEYKQALEKNPDSTLAVVDLEALRTNLSPQLDKLGLSLQLAVEDGALTKETLQKAQDKNCIDPFRDLVDMGGFLASLSSGLGEGQKELVAQIQKAKESLQDCILHTRTGSELPLSGLSFHSRPQELSHFGNPMSPADRDGSLPAGWTEFVASHLE